MGKFRVAPPAVDDCGICDLPLGLLRDTVKVKRGRVHKTCWNAEKS